MTARQIGEIIPGILSRCQQMMTFQDMLNAESDPSERKAMIMAARAGFLIDDIETSLLIEVYGVEAA